MDKKSISLLFRTNAHWSKISQWRKNQNRKSFKKVTKKKIKKTKCNFWQKSSYFCVKLRCSSYVAYFNSLIDYLDLSRGNINCIQSCKTTSNILAKKVFVLLLCWCTFIIAVGKAPVAENANCMWMEYNEIFEFDDIKKLRHSNRSR